MFLFGFHSVSADSVLSFGSVNWNLSLCFLLGFFFTHFQVVSSLAELLHVFAGGDKRHLNGGGKCNAGVRVRAGCLRDRFCNEEDVF